MTKKKSFLGFDFSPLTLDDQKIIDDFFQTYPQALCDYTFSLLISWNAINFYEWAYLDSETILFSLQINGKRHLLQPIGLFSEISQNKLLEAISLAEEIPCIFAVSSPFIEKNPEFCAKFEIYNERGNANYLYRTSDLKSLKGGHYEKKRNLISQIEKHHQWSLTPLTEKCKPYCPRILKDLAMQIKPELNEELQKELIALDFIMSHFQRLQLKGLLISVNGHPAAFSIYERLNKTTAVVHYEKAERQFKGLYQLINRETAKAIYAQGFEFINREEDLNIEGLRKAKMSYFPIDLVASHRLTLNI